MNPEELTNANKNCFAVKQKTKTKLLCARESNITLPHQRMLQQGL